MSIFNTARKALTLEDCMLLSDAGAEIYINDGLTTVIGGYDEDEESYYAIPDEFAELYEPAFS